MNLRALTRRLRSEEDGVVLVIVAILMTVFIGFAALAIDLGSLDGAQQRAQAAADAGALAGAAALTTPSNTTAASSTATTLAKTNYPTGTPSVTTSGNQVTVKVIANPPSFFGKAFPVSATAVAVPSIGGGAAGAIFASDTSCTGGGVSLGTNGGFTITGGVRSSGSMTISSHQGVYPSTTYLCNLNDGTTGDNYFNGATSTPSEPTVNGTFPATWPADYSANFPVYPLTASGDPNCTLVASDYNFQSLPSTTIANGVYCANTIEFNEGGLTCTCTFVAGSFQMNNGPDNFTPAFQSLSFYDVNDTGLNVNSNGPNFFNGGVLFAPKASVTVNAPSGNISGFVEAKDVTTNGGGSSSTWTGTGPTINGTSSGAALTQ
jgi:Putative Flp pilus-assembly TadE/G-like